MAQTATGTVSFAIWLRFVSAHGPLASAFVVTAWADGPDGLRDLLARLVRVRFNPLWWLAVLSPIIVLLLLALGLLVCRQNSWENKVE